ncbi:MAG: fatty acid desaturase [Salegentibacter sp.]
MEGTTTKKPKYKKDGGDFQELRKRTASLVKKLEKKKAWLIKFKAIFFPLLYIGAYFFLLKFGENPYFFYSTYFFLGVFLVLNFLNLIHDAVHDVIFKSPKWLNNLYVHFFDLLGANSYIWRIRHIRLHHAFPNVMNWDTDFEQSPMAKVFPQAESKQVHRYQHLYLPFLYPLYLFNWLLVRDFKDFFKKDTIVQREVRIPLKEYLKLFLFKVFFFGYIIILPKYILQVSWGAVIGGFILMVLTASLLSLLVLLSPHANVYSEFPQPDEKGNMPYSWFEHQLQCTNDISNDNFFIRFFMGCFNFHIAHHLFPDIHHIYYPEVTVLIEDYTKEHHLPYRKQSLFRSLAGHYSLLKKNAFQENIFEETM